MTDEEIGGFNGVKILKDKGFNSNFKKWTMITAYSKK